MKHPASLLVAGLILAAPLGAEPPAEPDVQAQVAHARELISSLKPQRGDITLPGGIAQITLPADFRYLDPKDTDTVLVGLWGNPPGGHHLGMIAPATFKPLSRTAWAVILDYNEDGHVKDNDAASINYDTLLQQMKKGAADANEDRRKQGFPTVELIGWAAPPRYDAASHKLYWAKQIRFGGKPPDTLNYNIRMLGRKGVLELNVVAPMSELADIEQSAPVILNMVNFSEGSRYADFNASTDKVAAYGLAALVAGGIAAKAGLFKLILAGILAAKKFVILAAAAVAAYVKKLFGRRKEEEAALEAEVAPPDKS